MGCDILVALGPATVTRGGLVGLNQFGNDGTGVLRYFPSRVHATGEQSSHPRVPVREVRQTSAVLGVQSPGSWGLNHGNNAHHVAAGTTKWRSRLAGPAGGLEGPDLVRLVLERSTSAHQGLDILTDLIERHGQTGTEGDHVFLLADSREAFVVEAAGHNWALLECPQTRAVCDTGLIRQDWRRLSRGLAELVLEHDWWPNDGTKLDFQASLGNPPAMARPALRRWSRATLALAQQEGALDIFCLRRLLQEHFDQCLDLLPHSGSWQGSWIASLHGALPLVWVAPGTLEEPLYFPLVVGEPLPEIWTEGLPAPRRRLGREESILEAYDRLQAQFDRDAEALMHHAAESSLQAEEMSRLCQEMMNRHLQLWIDHARPRRSSNSSAPVTFVNRQESQLAFVTE